MNEVVRPPLVPGIRDLQPLGQGGMGDVYKGVDATGRQVAVKVCRRVSRAGLERFRREAELLGRFRSDAVVQAHTWGVQGDMAYLVCELIEGETLDRAALRCGDAEARLRLATRVIETVGVAHREGVVHRDLKPTNVLVLPTGSVKLIDFGVAIGLDQDRMTRTGAFVGTPLYMAPEQFERTEPLPTADVWSLGVLAYEILSEGELPHYGDTLIQLAASWNRRPAAIGGVPRAVNRVLARALEPNPTKRYPDANALAVALEEAIETGDRGLSPSALLAVGVLIGALGVGGLWAADAFTQKPSEPAAPTPSVAAPAPSRSAAATPSLTPVAAATRPAWPVTWSGPLTKAEGRRLNGVNSSRVHLDLPFVKAMAERGEPRAARLYGLALVVGKSHGVVRNYPRGFAYLCYALKHGRLRAGGNLAPLFLSQEREPEHWRVYGYDEHRAGVGLNEDLRMALALAYLTTTGTTQRSNRVANEVLRYLRDELELRPPKSPAEAYRIIQQKLETDPVVQKVLAEAGLDLR